MIGMTKNELKKRNAGYVSPMTGRRRALSDGAMLDICQHYRKGVKVKTLAEQYGVSANTIYSIVYWTPKDSDV